MNVNPLHILGRFFRRFASRGTLVWSTALVVPVALFGGTFPASTSGHAEVQFAGVVEERAIEDVAQLGGIALSSDETDVCSTDRLRVSWDKPGDGFTRGSYIEPLGPRPGAHTTSVNGIVLCEGSTFAYAGFEAFVEGGEWVILLVPEMEDEDDVLKLNDVELPDPVTPEKKKAPKPKADLALPSPELPDDIDTYAQYQPQTTCDPTAKPGVSAFKKMVLDRFPSTRNGGITRGCSVGGRSEHKEGRALDWMANINKAKDKAAAEEVIDWLLATDEAGNAHAMARRAGVMYIIWNRQIWGSYRANEGWRGYNGASSHRDHVHFSFSWDGALGNTSFWSGSAVITEFQPPTRGGGRYKLASAHGTRSKKSWTRVAGAVDHKSRTRNWDAETWKKQAEASKKEAMDRWAEWKRLRDAQLTESSEETEPTSDAVTVEGSAGERHNDWRTRVDRRGTRDWSANTRTWRSRTDRTHTNDNRLSRTSRTRRYGPGTCSEACRAKFAHSSPTSQ